MSNISTRDAQGIAKAIANGEAFTTHGALKGGPTDPAMPLTSWDMGRLPREWYVGAMFATYVVWSYGTPIAWIDADGAWQCPGVKYSVTTSKHQSTTRYAFHIARNGVAV